MNILNHHGRDRMVVGFIITYSVYQYHHSINQSKFYLKSVHFITIQHKLSRAFQTDMHNKIT